jgi:hypothetical protein
MEQMYNLIDDSYENNDLLNGTLTAGEEKAKEVLEAELLIIRN